MNEIQFVVLCFMNTFLMKTYKYLHINKIRISFQCYAKPIVHCSCYFVVECSIESTTIGLSSEITSDGSTTNVEYRCGPGYSMTGIQNISCLPDGTWNSQAPACGIFLFHYLKA